jgi:hypothetical protein
VNVDRRERAGIHNKVAPIYYLLGVNRIREAKHLPHMFGTFWGKFTPFTPNTPHIFYANLL